MRKIFFLMAFFVCVIKSEDSFQKLGDIFRLAPLIPLAISIGIEDYEGAMQLALGTAASQVSVEVIKLGYTHKVQAWLLRSDLVAMNIEVCQADILQERLARLRMCIIAMGLGSLCHLLALVWLRRLLGFTLRSILLLKCLQEVR